jgi:hypothetical protein
MGLENAKAVWRQVDLSQVAGREAETVDVPVKHQRRDGWVAAKADAGQRPGMEYPLHICGKGGASRLL